MNLGGKSRAFGSLVAVFVTAVLLLAAIPARAAVTIDAPCAGGWNWNSQTQTLSCGTVTPPAPGVPTGCVLTPNPTSRPDAGPVRIDQARLVLAIRNLIDNALQYEPRGSVVTVTTGRIGTG